MSTLTNVESNRKSNNIGTQLENVDTSITKDRSILFHLKTLYLFTKSDFKTVIVPQAVFALAMMFSGSKLGVSVTNQLTTAYISTRLLSMFAWLWIQLLVVDISNQRFPESVAEDAINKPWRPLPSKRISMEEAQHMLRILVPAVVVISVAMGNFTPCSVIMVLAWLYNDLGAGNASLLQRNVINAVALSCFGWGALIVLFHFEGTAATLLRNWTILTATVMLTTVHVQDFPDIPGDRARGRKTIPLVYGEGWTRAGLAILIPLWSIACLAFWNIKSPVVWIPTLLVGNTMSLITMVRQEHSYDKIVWKLWCLWMTQLYLLPIFSART
ncbi:hypothetical protein Daesc_004094 [Daldinia eschscholtzii]|uniref:UbiA prenyltransferase n=1 Tax=Daldinia eschscholtzii TaxID=292717 RepID=A0AAX6MPN0_9PEZI